MVVTTRNAQVFGHRCRHWKSQILQSKGKILKSSKTTRSVERNQRTETSVIFDGEIHKIIQRGARIIQRGKQLTSNQVYTFLINLQNVLQSLLTPTMKYSELLSVLKRKAESHLKIQKHKTSCAELEWNIHSNLLALVQAE